MIADVSLVSAVWGRFMSHLPGWFEMVGRLDPAPAEVIVATFPEHVEELRGYPCTVVVEERPVPLGCALVPWMGNQAGFAASCTWLANLAMDDRMMPDALWGLDEVDADIVSISAQLSDGRLVQARGEQNLRTVAEDMVLGPSYIRSELFRRVGGWRADRLLADWWLWVYAYLAGGRIVTWDYPTHWIDVTSAGRFSSERFPEFEYQEIRAHMAAGLADGLR
jgi:hypothetical protein